MADDLKHLNQAITIVLKNTLIDDVVAADVVRDDLYIVFRDLISAYKRRKTTEIRSAYEKLWNLIEKAGTTLYVLGYNEQSGKLAALFDELDQEEYQEAMKQLNIVSVYQELKQSPVDFQTIYDERLSQEADLNYPTLKEARARIIPHINSLLSVIDVLVELEPKKYQQLADKLSTITKQVMAAARSRKTHAADAGQSEKMVA